MSDINGEVQKLIMDVTHKVPDYLRFVLGGDDLKEYPGFNG